MTEVDAKEIMLARLDALEEEDRLGREGQKIVTLDQQAVGRLSRMDALQSQAMAQAQAGRRAVERRRLQAALARLAEGEWGDCLDCGEEIGAARLAQDPTAPKCLSCARG